MKNISTLRILLSLILARLKTCFWISFNLFFFKYIFILIYIGAILVLILYLYFSSFKIIRHSFSLKMISLCWNILVFALFFFQKNFQKKFSKDFCFKVYSIKENFFIILICCYILFILICILKLDNFRFSSLRNLI